MSEHDTLKQRLKAGEAVFGPWCVIPSGSVTNIIASAGFDFVIVDLEHGPASFETAEHMVRAAQAEHAAAIVRLGSVDEEQILKSLDAGADGVLVAHVGSSEDARRATSLCRYHPDGQRGFSPYTRAGGYSGGAIAHHARRQNERVLTGVILEGRRATDDIDRILETPNLDLIYIGAYDLSQALGMPGQVWDPKVRHTIATCVRKIREAGIAAGGCVARNREDMMWMMDVGMQFITCLPDCALLHNAMSAAVETFCEVHRAIRSRSNDRRGHDPGPAGVEPLAAQSAG